MVCSTCSTIGANYLNDSGPCYGHLVIDEAARATEPATNSAASRCNIEDGNMTLVGDSRQLGPFVHSREVREAGLGLSTMKRCEGILGMSQNLFDIQYRMHPSIAAFPSQKFYDGKVGDGSNVHKHVRPQGIAWPCSSHNAFINVRADESRRFENKASARLILRIWKRILQQNNYNQDNMVIL